MTTTHVRASARRQNTERPPGADTQPEEQMMSSTKSPPESLEERAERAAAELAEVEAERHRIATAEAQRQAVHEARHDTELVGSYLDRKPDLERAVDDARHALDVAIAEHPLTVALGAFYTATALRHEAFSEYIGAVSRQGRDVSSARYPEQPTVHLPEQIDRAAQRAAMEARSHAAAAVEQSRANHEESK